MVSELSCASSGFPLHTFNVLSTPFYCALPTAIARTRMGSSLSASSDLTRHPYSSVPARNVRTSGTCKGKCIGDDSDPLPTLDCYPEVAKRQNYVFGCRENTVKGSREGCPRDRGSDRKTGDKESSDEDRRGKESSGEQSNEKKSSGEERSDEEGGGEEGRISLWIRSHVSQGVHAHDLTTDKNFLFRATNLLQIPTLSHLIDAPQSQPTKHF